NSLHEMERGVPPMAGRSAVLLLTISSTHRNIHNSEMEQMFTKLAFYCPSSKISLGFSCWMLSMLAPVPENSVLVISQKDKTERQVKITQILATCLASSSPLK